MIGMGGDGVGWDVVAVPSITATFFVSTAGDAVAAALGRAELAQRTRSAKPTTSIIPAFLPCAAWDARAISTGEWVCGAPVIGPGIGDQTA